MHRDVIELMNASDGWIVEKYVKEVTKTDFEMLVSFANEFRKAGNKVKECEVQHRIIEVMGKTIVHLAKQNALMDQDYKRGKS